MLCWTVLIRPPLCCLPQRAAWTGLQLNSTDGDMGRRPWREQG